MFLYLIPSYWNSSLFIKKLFVQQKIGRSKDFFQRRTVGASNFANPSSKWHPLFHLKRTFFKFRTDFLFLYCNWSFFISFLHSRSDASFSPTHQFLVPIQGFNGRFIQTLSSENWTTPRITLCSKRNSKLNRFWPISLIRLAFVGQYFRSLDLMIQESRQILGKLQG